MIPVVLHAAAAVEYEASKRREKWRRLDTCAEPGRQGRADFVDARVHEFGGVHELILACQHLGANAVEAARTGLEVGDANDIVIGERDRDLLAPLRWRAEAATAARRATWSRYSWPYATSW